jgi:hypothetical protein
MKLQCIFVVVACAFSDAKPNQNGSIRGNGKGNGVSSNASPTSSPISECVAGYEYDASLGCVVQFEYWPGTVTCTYPQVGHTAYGTCIDASECGAKNNMCEWEQLDNGLCYLAMVGCMENHTCEPDTGCTCIPGQECNDRVFPWDLRRYEVNWRRTKRKTQSFCICILDKNMLLRKI